MKYSRKQSTTSFEIPEEGKQPAKILYIKEGKKRRTMMGWTPSVLATFELANGQKVMQSILVYPGSKLLEKLLNVTHCLDGDEVDLDQLVGKTCRVNIEHNTVEGITYPNITDFFEVEESGVVVDSISIQTQ